MEWNLSVKVRSKMSDSYDVAIGVTISQIATARLNSSHLPRTVGEWSVVDPTKP